MYTYPPNKHASSSQTHGTQVRHHHILPVIPTHSLLDSVASASHYAGVPIHQSESVMMNANTATSLKSHLQVRYRMKLVYQGPIFNMLR